MRRAEGGHSSSSSEIHIWFFLWSTAASEKTHGWILSVFDPKLNCIIKKVKTSPPILPSKTRSQVSWDFQLSKGTSPIKSLFIWNVLCFLTPLHDYETHEGNLLIQTVAITITHILWNSTIARFKCYLLNINCIWKALDKVNCFIETKHWFTIFLAVTALCCSW